MADFDAIDIGDCVQRAGDAFEGNAQIAGTGFGLGGGGAGEQDEKNGSHTS